MFQPERRFLQKSNVKSFNQEEESQEDPEQ
jgi:hypothetical protein